MSAMAFDTAFSQISITSRVIVALVLRETKTRFGTRRTGYIWALIEPIAYVVIYLSLRDALRSAVPFGENLVLFTLTGVLTFRLYWSISSRAMHSINNNKPLLAYPPVKPNDVIAARIILETLTMYVVIMLFFLFIALQSGITVIVNHDNFFASILAVTLLASGVGTFNAVVSVLIQSWDRIFRMLSIPLFMSSGIFYVPKNMPLAMQKIIVWNPVLHCVEWMRTGVYLSYDPMLDRSYVLGWAIITLITGLTLERLFRYRLLSA
jgi:capsular polysaccharide transport system permease protein